MDTKNKIAETLEEIHGNDALNELKEYSQNDELSTFDLVEKKQTEKLKFSLVPPKGWKRTGNDEL